jgi:hypothetical protein
MFYQYWGFLAATRESFLNKDNKNIGLLLLINLIVWILPVWDAQRLSSQLKRAAFFPFNNISLFTIQFLSIFLMPTSLLATIVSAITFYPVFYAKFFLAGIFWWAICTLSSILIIFGCINLLKLAVSRQIIAAVIFLLFIYLLVTGNSGWRQLNEAGLFLNEALAGSVLQNTSWINVFLSFLCLFAAFAIAFFASFITFSYPESSLVTSKRVSFLDKLKISSKNGLLIKKDFRFFLSSLIPYLGLLVAAYFAYFLNLSKEDATQSFSFVLSFIFLINAFLAFNFFGYDNASAIDRYILSPINPDLIVKLKNATFLIIMSIQLIIIIPVIVFKFGIIAFIVFLLKFAILSLSYFTWGNFLSIIHPFRFNRFGSVFGIVFPYYSAAALFNTFVLILTDSVSEASLTARLWISVPVFFGTLLIYLFSLYWGNKKIPYRWEEIRTQVS